MNPLLPLIPCLLAFLCPAPASSQIFTPPATASGSPITAPMCSETSIPAGANVVAATETAFGTVCVTPGGVLTPGSVLTFDSRFQLGVAVTVPMLQGRVYAASTATPNLATCVGDSTCVRLLDTGSVGGLTAGSGLYGGASVSVTVASCTSLEASGQLTFQTAATAAISIAAQSASAASSVPLTIPWNVCTTPTYWPYSAKFSAANAANYIQLRQQTLK